MPEEKVSRKADINKIPVTSANTASEYYPSPTGPIRRLDGLDEPPAADAGPRQPSRYKPNPRLLYGCPYCNEPLRLRDADAVVDSYQNVCHLACFDKNCSEGL